MSAELHLNGKVAVVTGASRGIGEAIAKRFAEAGAKVVLASRKLEGLEKVAEEIRRAGGEALPYACHMGKDDQVKALFGATTERWGKVDVLVNNAATNPHFGPMMHIEEAAWDKTFEVNVKGYFSATRAFVEALNARGSGRGSIINVASVVGTMGAPMQGVYAMTKAAVISMTKTLSIELGPRIRVNAIAPGLVETRFAAALTQNEAILKMVLDRTSLKRVGQPEDIAGPALLLASDAGAYINGEVLVVDGGWTTG